MVAPLEHFGQPKKFTEQSYHISIHGHPEGLEYVLVRSIVWVDEGLPKNVPHQYRSWYRHFSNGRGEGFVSEFDIHLYVIKVAFGMGTANPKN